jgi:hypothetical protein
MHERRAGTFLVRQGKGEVAELVFMFLVVAPTVEPTHRLVRADDSGLS